MRYRAASSSGDLQAMIAATSILGTTAFHRELVIDFALRNNLSLEAKELAEDLVLDYPRDFFGWRVLSILDVNSAEQRLQAIERLKELDPFNPNFK